MNVVKRRPELRDCRGNARAASYIHPEKFVPGQEIIVKLLYRNRAGRVQGGDKCRLGGEGSQVLE